MAYGRGIINELRHHAPFTLTGAVLGLTFMFLFRRWGSSGGHHLFMVFHPTHVLLSAMVTAAIFKLHRTQSSFLLVLLIGYVGSIGVATLSDSIIPYFGEKVLGLDIPSHEETFGGHGESENHDATRTHDDTADKQHLHPDEQEHSSRGVHLHLGFIEEWYIVNPAALMGIVMAWFMPHTKLSHMSHVLISTWASSAHVLMNTGGYYNLGVWVGLLGVLFLAVWLPCCVSDIVFPMLFVGSGHKPATGHCGCSEHCH